MRAARQGAILRPAAGGEIRSNRMYKLSRLMLALTIVLSAYCLSIAIFLGIQQNVPPDKQGIVWAILIVAMMVTLARKKGRRLLTAFGTAAWASSADLLRAGMIGA